jgi:serine/threonine-protein kinase
VLDFGIAKFTDRSISATSATRTGSVLGTPFYMSPEQARGLRSVDHRTDVWSLGVIAYRCIVGNLPFDGEAIGDLLVRLCTEPIPVPSQMMPDVPPGFDGFIERALCRDLTKRFQTVQELADALARSCGVPARSVLASQDLSQPTPELPHVIAAPSRVDSRSNAAVTEGALTQSADPTQVPRGARVPRFAVAAALVVLLAVGAGAAARALPNFGEARSTEAAGVVMAAEPESPPAPVPPAREPVTPTPLVELEAPPAPVASVRPASSTVPVLPRPSQAVARRRVRAPIAREAPSADPGLKQGKRQIDLGY